MTSHTSVYSALIDAREPIALRTRTSTRRLAVASRRMIPVCTGMYYPSVGVLQPALHGPHQISP
jgi:hypothetical protein